MSANRMRLSLGVVGCISPGIIETICLGGGRRGNVMRR